MRKCLMLLMLFLPALLLAQGKKVSGKVIDTGGLPLPGVSIVIKGTTTGAITDINGEYLLGAVSDEAILVFSFIGFENQTIPVAGKSVINVTMKESSIGLDEVVAVGYGTVKKSDVTGAVTKVNEKALKEKPVQNALQAVQGKAAGVDIVSNVRPGEVASINIRGTRSISGSNSPLVVVDGIILMGTLNDINPNDIASLEILKDASATAIYGSRGANGVMLITTKSGKKGAVSVNYEASLSIDKIHSLTDWASSGEALDRYRLAEINNSSYKSGNTAIKYPDPFADIQTFGNSDATTIAAIRSAYKWNDETYTSVQMRDATEAELALGYPSQVPVYNSKKIPTTDWIDLLTKPSYTQNHNISLSSGSEISNLYFSFGYLNNEGTQKNQDYNRYTVKINGDIAPTKWLKVGASINAAKSTQLYGTVFRSGSATGAKDAYGMALSQYVMAKPYDKDGNMILFPGNNTTLPVWNPLIDIDETKDERKIANVNANMFGEIKLFPWLKYRMNFGSGYRYWRKGTFQSSKSTLMRTGTPATSTASYENQEEFQYMVENLLYFDKTIGNHTLGATVMHSAQEFRRESANLSASKILYDASEWFNLGANLNGKPDGYGTGLYETSMESYMARLNYSYRSRYLLTATIRQDGSSVLATGNKTDIFPSFAAAWKMQEEGFIQQFPFISELKLRAGYGVTGNSGVEAYQTMGPLTRYNYVFGASNYAIGYIPKTMANPKLGWEKTAQTNVGLDFGFLKGRISGSVEYYISNTSDILMTRDIPVVTGYPNILYNIGKMENKGLEITLSTVNYNQNGWKWTTDLNWSKNNEKIVELVNGKQDMKANGWFIGQPLQVFRNYKVDGLWQNTDEDLAEIALWKANGYNFAPGQYKPVEQGTPDHKLTDDDMVIRGTARPKWVGGMTNTVSYKNFELSCFVYARVGQKYFSSLIPGGTLTGGSRFVGYVRSVGTDQFWSPTNTDAKYPQPTAATGVAAVNQATYINDGSFVAVRNIGLSYNVPSSLLQKVNMKNLQVYGQVLNPFMFGGEVVKAGINPDDTNGWASVNSVGDPTGGTNNNTMLIRSVVFGVRVGF